MDIFVLKSPIFIYYFFFESVGYNILEHLHIVRLICSTVLLDLKNKVGALENKKSLHDWLIGQKFLHRLPLNWTKVLGYTLIRCNPTFHCSYTF